MALTPTTIRAAAELTAALVATNPVRVRSASHLEFLIDVQAQGSVTEIQVDFQTSIETDGDAPGSAQWANVQAEEVSAGIATLNDYVLKKTISGPIKIPVLVPALGNWIRARIKASVGGVSGSLVAISALQRTQAVKATG